ncbi:MAG: hypothetical protein KIS75_09275 [Chromatiales bacterium]|nr:hypothetical protein [Chromatiales bacterium]
MITDFAIVLSGEHAVTGCTGGTGAKQGIDNCGANGDQSATSFDYVVRSELSSNRQYGAGGQALVGYKLELKLFTISGEMQGQWSGTLTLAKGQKSFL